MMTLIWYAPNSMFYVTISPTSEEQTLVATAFPPVRHSLAPWWPASRALTHCPRPAPLTTDLRKAPRRDSARVRRG